MKAKYVGKEYAKYYGNELYNVEVSSVFVENSKPAHLRIIDPDGDYHTISLNGGATMAKGWILIHC